MHESEIDNLQDEERRYPFTLLRNTNGKKLQLRSILLMSWFWKESSRSTTLVSWNCLI